MTRPRALRARLLLPGVMIALGVAGCPKKKDKTDEEDATETVQDIEGALNLSSIDPSTVPAGEAFDATLFGAGFQPGATVYLGAEEASGVTYASPRTLEIRGPSMTAGRYDVEVVLPDGQRSRLVQGLRVENEAVDCREVVIYFDLDQDGLRSDSLAELKSNLSCLTGTSAPLTIEGHTDERGTTEYNLALGQRRAATVRDWLVRNSIASGRIRTVTFGEERPVDRGHDEGAWARNRRAIVRLGN